MKRSCLELSINEIIRRRILKKNNQMLSLCFITFAPKTDAVFSVLVG